MCIVALAWQVLDHKPVCLISNRDEFYHRPSQAVHLWQESEMIAGKDLQGNGTWLGVNKQGKWAIITNYRDAHDQTAYTTTRGDLVKNYLQSTNSPMQYLKQLEPTQTAYAGFNLIVGDTHQACYMSNRGEAPQYLANGVYVLSNTILSEFWFKTAHLRKRFTQELLPLIASQPLEQSLNSVWDILQDDRTLDDTQLPNTGIGLEWEKALSPTFIATKNYGTQSSNFLVFQSDTQQFLWWEKQHHTATAEPIKHTIDVVASK